MEKAPNVTQINTLELYSLWFFQELQTAGYVKRVDREPESIEVIPNQYHIREKNYKTRANTTEEYLVERARTYTYDYRIVWTKKALYYFTEVWDKNVPFKFGHPNFVSHMVEGEMVSYIDVKPHANVQARGSRVVSSAYTFPFVMKLILIRYNMYINKMIPIPMAGGGARTAMFVKTFTPNRYLYTDGGGMLRKVPKWNRTSLNIFLRKRGAVIEKRLAEDRVKAEKNSQQTLL